MLERIAETASFLAFVAAGNKDDAADLPALDRLTAKALRYCKRAREAQHVEALAQGRELVAELNETRRCYRSGKYRRGRIALRAAGVLCSAIVSHHVSAAPVHKAACFPASDLVMAERVVIVGIPDIVQFADRIAASDDVAAIFEHSASRAYLMTGAESPQVYLSNGETACTSKALEMDVPKGAAMRAMRKPAENGASAMVRMIGEE